MNNFVAVTADDFASFYPQYGKLALGEGRFLFDLLSSPTAHLKAKITTLDLDMPAVAGVAKDVAAACSAHAIELDSFKKQFVGAVVCFVMERNGFKKTNTKRAIPHPAFKKGEFYELAV
jgi:hypothetical protein